MVRWEARVSFGIGIGRCCPSNEGNSLSFELGMRGCCSQENECATDKVAGEQWGTGK